MSEQNITEEFSTDSKESLAEKRQLLLKLAKRRRNEQTYEKRNTSKQICHVCCVEVDKYYFSKHLETRRHIKFQELSETTKQKSK